MENVKYAGFLNKLICDNEKDIVSALKLYLTSAEYNLYEAFTGKEALDVIKRNEIHLVLLDIMIPRMPDICGTFLIIYSTIFINMHSRVPGYI